MNIVETGLPGVLIIEPRVFGDARGFFLESWNRQSFADAGLDLDFVQEMQTGVVIGLPDQLYRIAIAGHQFDDDRACLR
jgi:dTDP-4-dehydrorhamnose 3,5-epimerase